MTLDHTRDLMHHNPLAQEPTDLATTTAALFMTRWITHLCAPTFVFLSGTSVFLSMKQQSNVHESRIFLFKRGIWLILLNFTINNFGIFFDPNFSVFFSQVIAAIGFGFIGLGLLLNLPPRVIGAIGLVIIAGHNLFQGIAFPQNQALNILWTLLMRVGYFQITPDHGLLIAYALIPWGAILLAGFGFGSILEQTTEKTPKRLLWLGTVMFLAFVLLRALNMYGDPRPWSVQKDNVFTVLSFINTTKQPPSLLFTLMTLGISIILMALVSAVQNVATKLISVYGKVPLFYWLLHWYVLHFVAIGYYLLAGYHWTDLQFTGFGFGRPNDGNGMSLIQIYLTWIIVVLLLYPVMRWFGQYKMKNKDKEWLRYF
jgi:uncharacterized membrane protein